MKLICNITFFNSLLLLFLICFCSESVIAQEKTDKEIIAVAYSEETDKTTVILKGVKLPNNKDSFSVGALFEYKGKQPEKEPCCVILFMTSVNKKNFQYKENHNLTIWADKEKFDFGAINWRESYHGTAFSIAGIGFFEEMYIGMERDRFSKIANAKEVKVQLGKFTFKMTSEQIEGFRELSQRMKPSVVAIGN